MPVTYPQINGHRLSFSSIEATFNGTKILGFKSLSYDDGLEIGKIFGAASQKLGTTAGKNDPTGSFEMYMEEGDLFLSTLGDGYGKKQFSIIATFSEDPVSPPIRVDLVGCRIIKVSESHSEGTDALTYKFDIDIMQIARNGRTIAGVFDTRNLS